MFDEFIKQVQIRKPDFEKKLDDNDSIVKWIREKARLRLPIFDWILFKFWEDLTEKFQNMIVRNHEVTVDERGVTHNFTGITFHHKTGITEIIPYDPNEKIPESTDSITEHKSEPDPQTIHFLTTKTTKTMDFGEALVHLKAGKRIARRGWNGRGMWLAIIHPGNAMFTGFGGGWPMQPCIGMKTADNNMQPGWLASQADILAEDWELAEPY